MTLNIVFLIYYCQVKCIFQTLLYRSFGPTVKFLKRSGNTLKSLINMFIHKSIHKSFSSHSNLRSLFTLEIRRTDVPSRLWSMQVMTSGGRVRMSGPPKSPKISVLFRMCAGAPEALTTNNRAAASSSLACRKARNCASTSPHKKLIRALASGESSDILCL